MQPGALLRLGLPAGAESPAVRAQAVLFARLTFCVPFLDWATRAGAGRGVCRE